MSRWLIGALALIAALIVVGLVQAAEIDKQQQQLDTLRTEINRTEYKVEKQKQKIEKQEKEIDALTGEYSGTYKYTYYCTGCNSPAGSTATSYGYYEPGYTVASNDFPLGTKIRVVKDGKSSVHMVTDRMAKSGVIDFATHTHDGNCGCSGTGTCEVYVL